MSRPVDVIDEKIISNEYAALLTHEIDHLNGILFIDYNHAGIDT
jgi:peptide deformylase